MVFVFFGSLGYCNSNKHCGSLRFSIVVVSSRASKDVVVGVVLAIVVFLVDKIIYTVVLVTNGSRSYLVS